jgi:NAD(P)-dependent dehydrogenase (short-subunit alcohol dehydrogenase family)
MGRSEGELSGQVAVVTGASRGIGRATAIELARRGADVVLVARSEDSLKATAGEIESLGRKALPVPADVSNISQAFAMAEKVRETFGHVEILVNNAAILGPIEHAYKVDPMEWARTIEINLIGVFNVTHSILPSMVFQQYGRIVNVSSGAAVKPRKWWSAYATSKAGVNQFSRVLSMEVAQFNILVNVIYPGVVATRMQEELRNTPPEHWDAEQAKLFQQLYKDGELLLPEEPAKLIAWLVGPEGARVNGAILDIRNPSVRAQAGLPPL